MDVCTINLLRIDPLLMAIGHRPLDLRLGRRRRAEDVERYTALRARRRITTDGFAGDGIGDGVARGDPMRLPGGVRFGDVVGHVAILPEGFPLDRKSTRLNSSH